MLVYMVDSDTNRIIILLFPFNFQFFVGLPRLYATRAISGHSVPIIAGLSANAASFIRLLGPESIGGLGDFAARIDAEAARTGIPLDEIAHQVDICRIISK